MHGNYDVIVIGAGPAGLTSGLYCAQGGLKVLALEKETIGGQITNIEKIENYPGFSEGVAGSQLRQAMALQAMNYGLEIKIDEVQGIDSFQNKKRVKTAGGQYLSKVLIIASGGHPLRLGVPGENKFMNKGLAYCAICEGGQFKDKVVAVAGGGDAGITEALYLSKLAKRIIIVEAMPVLTAKHFLQERARNNNKIEIICNTRIKSISGDAWVNSIEVVNNEANEMKSLPVEGVLVHIGWKPNTKYIEDVVPLNSQGEIVVNGRMETEVPGIYAAGDIREDSRHQLATAVGDGATAGISALKYIQETLDNYEIEDDDVIY